MDINPAIKHPQNTEIKKKSMFKGSDGHVTSRHTYTQYKHEKKRRLTRHVVCVCVCVLVVDRTDGLKLFPQQRERRRLRSLG